MKKQFGILAAAVAALSVSAQANALSAGDLAVIAYNSDGDDNFAWVALTDIAANTTINFTDSSWQGSAFRTSEHLDAGGPLTWSYGSTLTAGTVVTYSGKTTSAWSVGTRSGDFLNLSNDGDQIFSYLGSNSTPAFISGIQFAHATGIIEGPVSNSTNTTNVPGGLSLTAGTMFNAGNFDNGYYSGITAGSRQELIAAFSSASNWTVSNSNTATTPWKTAFTVTAVPEPETYAMFLAGLGLIGAMARRRAAWVR